MMQTSPFIFILLLIAACNTPKTSVNKGESPSNSQGCTTLIQAKDFTGLDGCQMLLITPDQQKLLVAENTTGTIINVGGTYKIGYEVIPDGISACMAENAMVRLTCAEEIELKMPAPRECYVEDNALEVPFLKKIIDSQRVQRIIRHDFRDGAAYVVSTKNAAELFDCQGNNMCEEIKKVFADCFSFYKKDFGGSKIIFQGEGPQD